MTATTHTRAAAEVTALPATRPSRVVVEPVRPVVDGGRFPAKATVDEPVVVEADVFADGHDQVTAALRYRRLDDGQDRGWTEVPMTSLGNDRWQARFVPDQLGRWEYTVHGWIDQFASWHHGIRAKSFDGQDVTVEYEVGRRLLSQIQADHDRDRRVLADAADALARGELGAVDQPELLAAVARHQQREPLATLAAPLPLRVERLRAQFGAWYEFFPRSTVTPARPGSPQRPGTLASAVGRLDHIAGMGFDIVYLPPIHPIGATRRKGRDNAVEAAPGDPGSPWGIGSPAGGHTAVDPDLGTIDDLVALNAACRERGLELALDIAFQCSPDHPWVSEHPTWFRHRPDGSVQYAENPPKRYQDIYPLDFESDDWRHLWLALRGVFTHWIDHGIRAFRVDNPHTKALPFWEWAITTLLDEHPDLIFLSEAFTRPRVMQRLAKVGFTQSYTYFTWRQNAWELREYFEELAGPTVDFLRPNLWPNTPDILTAELQTSGRPAFVTRAVLAATLGPSWGVYGPAFELGEHRPVRAGSEEYLHSEKYEVREWDLDQPGSLARLLGRLNRIRRNEPALRRLDTLHFHGVDNPWLLAYSKTDPAGRGDPVLVVANVDHHEAHAATVDIDWAALGLPTGARYRLVDQLGGATYEWSGRDRNHVHLSPWSVSAHVFTVSLAEPEPGSESHG